MALVLSRLGLSGAPEGDFGSLIEGAGTADGSATAESGVDQEYTTLGLGGFGVSSPLHVYYVISDTAAGLSSGTSVVDGQGSLLKLSVGTALGTSSATAEYGIPDYLTTLGLGGYPSTQPLREPPLGSEGEGSASGTCLVDGVSDIAVIEDVGDDLVTLQAITVVAAATVATNVLEVNPSGGLSFAGTSPRLKGFNYQTVGGLVLAGTARAVKSRTWNPTLGITFSGFGGGGGNQQQFYEYTATGGIQFGGTGSVEFFKDYGPGATGKIRDKRRLTHSTRSYSRG